MNRHDELEADFAQYYHLDLERMGEDFSHAHAACLAAQLPSTSRCNASLDPHAKWDELTWMMWRVEREMAVLRWSFCRYDNEPQPEYLPYPGKEKDKTVARERHERSKAAVDAAFGMMDGGNDGD